MTRGCMPGLPTAVRVHLLLLWTAAAKTNTVMRLKPAASVHFVAALMKVSSEPKERFNFFCPWEATETETAYAARASLADIF